MPAVSAISPAPPRRQRIINNHPARDIVVAGAEMRAGAPAQLAAQNRGVYSILAGVGAISGLLSAAG